MTYCSIEQCDSPIKSRVTKLCNLHHKRLIRNGDPLKVYRVRGKVCRLRDCQRKHHTKGYCQYHYNHVVRYGDALKNPNPKDLHGYSRTSEYRAWSHMKERCTKVHHKEFKNYGARGITVCDDWFNSFRNFYEYIGPKPTSKHTLDRIDNDGNYEPGNIRWATVSQQNANKRR